jgi:hypothetical protein
MCLETLGKGRSGSATEKHRRPPSRNFIQMTSYDSLIGERGLKPGNIPSAKKTQHSRLSQLAAG